MPPTAIAGDTLQRFNFLHPNAAGRPKTSLHSKTNPPIRASQTTSQFLLPSPNFGACHSIPLIWRTMEDLVATQISSHATKEGGWKSKTTHPTSNHLKPQVAQIQISPPKSTTNLNQFPKETPCSLPAQRQSVFFSWFCRPKQTRHHVLICHAALFFPELWPSCPFTHNIISCCVPPILKAPRSVRWFRSDFLEYVFDFRLWRPPSKSSKKMPQKNPKTTPPFLFPGLSN